MKNDILNISGGASNSWHCVMSYLCHLSQRVADGTVKYNESQWADDRKGSPELRARTTASKFVCRSV